MLVTVAVVIGGLAWSIRALIHRLGHHVDPVKQAIAQVDQPRQQTPAPHRQAVDSPAPTPMVPAPSRKAASQTPQPSPTAPSIPAQPVPTPTVPQDTTTQLRLPADWIAVTRRADITLVAQNATTVKMLVSRVTAPFTISMKGCVPLALLAKPTEPAFVVAPCTSISVQAGISVQTFSLPVASVDPSSFRKPPLEQKLQVMTGPIDGRLTTYMETVSARTSDWRVVQAGAWILSRNTAIFDLETLRMPLIDPMSGQTKVVRVADYREIKAVEGILSSLGWNPDVFKVFPEEAAALKVFLEQTDFAQRGPDYDRIITSDAPARYKGNSQVERRLRDCMQQHARYSTRCRAFENLLTVGLTSSPDNLRYTAQQHPDIRERFLAAWSLVSNGHDEGLPFLALCASDPLLGPQADTTVAYLVTSRTGKTRLPNETTFDFWSRAMSTVAYQQRPQLENEVKWAITQQAAETDPRLTAAMENMASPDDSTVQSACSQLTAYPRSASAFNALTRAALKHPSESVRYQSLQNLRSFRDFSPASVCAAILDSKNESMMTYAASLLCENVFDDSLPVLDKAIRSNSTYVRRLVAQQAGLIPLPELSARLVKMSRYDSDRSVQIAATESLCRLHEPEGIKTIASLLRSGERGKKTDAMNLIPIWGFDTQVLELLKKYRTDGDIGQWAERDLSEHSTGTTYR